MNMENCKGCEFCTDGSDCPTLNASQGNPRIKEFTDIINRLVDFENAHPGALQIEFFDFLHVVSMGAKKYAMNNWLESDGKRASHKAMHDSMFHHLAESFAGKGNDEESGIPSLLHLACRALMSHTRNSRGIKHPEDK